MLSLGRARQARALPAAPPPPKKLSPAPLPRGYIDTGDLMTTATTGETRIDLNRRAPELVGALRRRPKQPGFAPGREPALPAPARTVYASVVRPDRLSNSDWRLLVAAVRSAWASDWVVHEMATPIDSDYPSVLWVLLVPADRIVSAQDKVMAQIEAVGLAPLANVVWSEASPRTLRRPS